MTELSKSTYIFNLTQGNSNYSRPPAASYLGQGIGTEDLSLDTTYDPVMMQVFTKSEGGCQSSKVQGFGHPDDNAIWRNS